MTTKREEDLSVALVALTTMAERYIEVERPIGAPTRGALLNAITVARHVLLDKDDSTELEKAITLALSRHRHQVDKQGAPYICHLLRVMMQFGDDDARIVGLLHDIVEDTDVTLDELHNLGVAPHRVAAIDALTKRAGESYEAYLARVQTNPLAVRVKVVDLHDNLARLTPALEHLRPKYLKALDVLDDFTDDPPHTGDDELVDAVSAVRSALESILDETVDRDDIITSAQAALDDLKPVEVFVLQSRGFFIAADQVARTPQCESCDARATHTTTDDVPVCKPCYDQLAKEQG